MMEPVSLLVPNYNGARFLRETVRALLRQTHSHLTLTVLDNRSTDDSAAIVREFNDARIRLVMAEEHVPLTANFNRALKLADAPYFALCASDEVYEPTWLEVMVRLLDEHPDAFFACCKADSADERGRIYLARQEQYKGTFWPANEPCVFTPALHLRALQQGNFLIITTGLFRGTAARQVGALNERFNFVADWEFFARGFLAGFSIVGTHQRLVHYRRHAQMMTQKLSANLRRFEEEEAFARWVAQAGYEKQLLPTPCPYFAPVRNTLLSEFANRLAARDVDGARQLLQFGEAHMPEFRGSPAGLLMRSALHAGRPGGLVLKACEKSYLSLLSLLHRS